ncbi:MAG TPA: biotin/lipoyl-containing protein, partial [Rhizobiaceae bacterium]
MPTEVILPKVDMDMATGQISRWFVAEGATVKQGELLFEIETDKAAMEIDSPAAGTIRDIVGKEGVDIAVGSPVAWIYAAGEAYQKEAPTSPSEGGGRAEGAGGGDTPSPQAKPETETPTPALRADPPLKGEGGTRATPLARRIARENGVSLSAVAGSGPHGRIGRADVEAAIAGLSSPLEGEVAAKRTEGVASEGTAIPPSTALATPPDRPTAGHPPLKGEG